MRARYRLISKVAQEFGALVTLWAALFDDGYQTVWYADREKAVAAGERRATAATQKGGA